MQEVKSETSASSAVVAGGIGGVLLLVGSFLTWATVSLNIAKFAQLLHVPEATIAASSASFSTHVAGTKADGKYTLVLGIVVIVGAVVAFTQAGAKKMGGLIMVIGGAIGALIPVIEILTKTSQINSAIGDSSAALAQAGISADVFKSLFSITWGIGLWACLIGGIVAVVGGAMSLRSGGQPAMAGLPGGGIPPPMSDSGFGTSTVAGSMAAPVSPPPPPMDMPPTSEPAAPPTADPAPPATDTTGGDAGDGATTS